MDERVLPHNLEAERAALGAAMISEPGLRTILAMLLPGDFFRKAHRDIVVAMQELTEASVTIDAITLIDRLRSTGKLEDVGGPAYVASLMDGVPHSTNAEHYAAIVKEHARLRGIIDASNDMTASAYASMSAAAVVSFGVDRLMKQVGSPAQRPVDIAQAAVEYTQALDAGTALLPTGYIDLDGLVGGLPIGGLTVIAARPSVGKTTMSLGIADRVAQRGRGAVYFSLEMRRAELGARIVSWRSRVPTTNLERGVASDADYANVVEAQANLVGLPLYVDESSTTLVEIDAWCRRLRDQFGDIACVFVDYLQLLMTTSRQASRQEEVASISRGLKRMAKELHVAVVALSQLSRAPEARSDKRPHLSDLRESGALEQDADLAILLFRPEMHKRTDDNEGIAECIVAKNRTGPVGVTRLCFMESLAQFDNLATF